jgi:hypothetical protein
MYVIKLIKKGAKAPFFIIGRDYYKTTFELTTVAGVVPFFQIIPTTFNLLLFQAGLR